jgi:hypothetical protein
MNGTMLMSERLVCVDLASCGIVSFSEIVPKHSDIRDHRPAIRKRRTV